MNRSKELKVLINKTKKQIIKEIDRIVECNLDYSKNSIFEHFNYIDTADNFEDFNEIVKDASNYIKKTVMEELFHEYTINENKNN